MIGGINSPEDPNPFEGDLNKDLRNNEDPNKNGDEKAPSEEARKRLDELFEEERKRFSPEENQSTEKRPEENTASESGESDVGNVEGINFIKGTGEEGVENDDLDENQLRELEEGLKGADIQIEVNPDSPDENNEGRPETSGQ
ncbi:MAG: hypothetical protein U5L75_00830 [Candidatus Campbellbacteria bacterium]|nr:hypothetical protein [Candidatus Campbellbacteria bacterium]